MLPFSTKTDLEEAAKNADIAVERRTAFLNLICAEHSLPEARAQLESLWSTWLDTHYPSGADVGPDGFSQQMPTTPTEADIAEAEAALAAENPEEGITMAAAAPAAAPAAGRPAPGPAAPAAAAGGIS